MSEEAELEKLAVQVCGYCYRAANMRARGEKGHTLRYRADTKEWVHDFVSGNTTTHVFCSATDWRKKKSG